MDATIRTTKHAVRRFKERAKLPARAAKRMAELAFTRGIDGADPSLSPAIRGKIVRARQNNAHVTLDPTYRVYQGCLYVFSTHGALLTVLEGFDDPDQRGRNTDVSGQRWLRNERQVFKNSQRPRRAFCEGDDE